MTTTLATTNDTRKPMQTDQELYESVRDAVRADPDLNDYAGTLRGVAAVLERKGVQPLPDDSGRPRPLAWELSGRFHDPLVAVKSEPLATIAVWMDARLTTEEAHLTFETRSIFREHGVLSQECNKTPQEVLGLLERDAQRDDGWNAAVRRAKQAATDLRRSVEIVELLAGETENTRKTKALADRLTAAAESRKARIKQMARDAKAAIAAEPVNNARKLQPLVTKGVSVTQAWEGNIVDPESQYVADRRMLFDTTLLSPADAKMLRRRNHDSYRAKADHMARLWQAATEATRPLRLLGVLGGLAVFADQGDGLHYAHATLIGYAVRITKADGYVIANTKAIGTGAAVVLTRDGTPVAVVMVMRGGPPVDVRVATACSKGNGK